MRRLNNTKSDPVLDVLRICILDSRIMNNPYIKDACHNIKAGYSGEEKVIRYLSEVRLKGDVHIFRNIILDGAQFDVIVVTPRLICILEVKNMTGEFYFDSGTGQFYRIKNGQKEGMRNPELQLQRAVRVLQRRLDCTGISLSVQGLIVLASRSGIVVAPPTHFPAIPIDALCFALERMEELGERIPSDEITRIRGILMGGENEVYDEKLFERLGIEQHSVKPGVRCMQCYEVGMTRAYSTWICNECGTKDRNAHFAALQEYQLLYGKEITSIGLKWWLQINDRHLLKRIIHAAKEDSYGTNRRKIYLLKSDFNLLNGFLAFEMKKR